MTTETNPPRPTPPFSRISDDVVFGQNVALYGYCNLYGCTIGDDCTIGPFVEVQRDVTLGRQVKIQSHTFICSGVSIDDEAFIGHGVMFINDRFPRSTTSDGRKKGGADWLCEPTHIGRRAAIGSNATILCGISVGEGALVGAGSVVTKDVPPFTVVAGNPARFVRHVLPGDEHPGEADLLLTNTPQHDSPEVTVHVDSLPANSLKAKPAVNVSTSSRDSANCEPVPFLNLRAQHKELKSELLAVVERALDDAAFVGGSEVEHFEQEFAEYCRCGHTVGVGSGTDALRFALQALGVQPGVSVITVPNTFVATAAAITQAGGEIEFVGVDSQTCLMCPDRLEEHLSRRARDTTGPRPGVVIPVHLYGQCADMDAISDIARRYGLRVLEDAAQAHGSLYRGRAAGSLGDAAAFSFYPGKNLGACGEAGAVTTNDPQIARQVQLLRDHGRSSKYTHAIEGYNGRLDALQAGLLRVKLKHLPRANALRQQWARIYDDALRQVPDVVPVTVLPDRTSSYHLYVVRTPQRDALQSFLAERQIATGVHYPIPLHLQECYRRLGGRVGDFPTAEQAAHEVLSLPMFPELTWNQVQRVIESVREFAQSGLSLPSTRRAA